MSNALHQFHDARQTARAKLEAAAREPLVSVKAVVRRPFAPVDVLAKARDDASQRQVEAYRAWRSPSARIKSEVAEKHGITVADIEGLSRPHELSIPRHELMYRLRVDLEKSYPQIAKLLGDRDHTTVIYGARRHAERNGLPMPPREFRSMVTIETVIRTMRQLRRFTKVSLGQALIGRDSGHDLAYAGGARAMDRIRKGADRLGVHIRHDKAAARYYLVTEADPFSRHAVLPRNPAEKGGV